MTTVIPHYSVKLSALRQMLREMQRVVVAYSGGVDSTLLLCVAKEVLGDDVLAVTAVSELTPHEEGQDTVYLAESIGAAHMLVATDDLADPVFTANPPDKCYHCKKSRFSRLKALALEKGYPFIVDGTNSDDHRDYRPGMKALAELGIRSPLKEAGLDKKEVRRLSRDLGLPTWDKPALACLASRIPYHQEITAAKLRQIDEAETFIRHLGVCGQVRVRHHGSVARLEVAPGAIAEFATEEIRHRVTAYFQTIGFQFVALDLTGYVMGSLNRDIQGKGV